MLSFELYNLNEELIYPESIISYELASDYDAPCDGLRLTFIQSKCPDEIYNVRAYSDGELIFNGYADMQWEQIDENGYTVFIYARSSACILLDNEAEPRSYYKPSLLSLFEINAGEYGFLSELPDMCCSSDYLVGKGTSCYEAINNFVSGITGRNIRIDANDVVRIAQNGDCVHINPDLVISEKRIINRGSALSVIDYKINSEADYNYHFKSRFMEKQRINRKRKINISALPVWQREAVLRNMLHKACTAYNSIELIVSECCIIPLYSKLDYSSCLGNMEDYFVTSCKTVCDKNGEHTKIILNREIEAEEISYVAE